MTTVLIDNVRLAECARQLEQLGRDLSSTVGELEREADFVAGADAQIGNALAPIRELLHRFTAANRYVGLENGHLSRIRSGVEELRSFAHDLELAAEEGGSLFAQVAAGTAMAAAFEAMVMPLPTRPLGELNEFVQARAFAATATRVRARTRRAPRSLDEFVGLIPSDPEQVRIVKVTALSGEVSYVVCARGLDLRSRGVNDPTATLSAFGSDSGPYTRAIADAMRREIPEGSNVMLVGHSQGGIEMVNVANSSVRDRYRITHLVTVGSPVEQKRTPRNVNWLRVENERDFVPQLDGNPRGVDDRTYQFSEGKKAHDGSTYGRVMAKPEFRNSQAYRQFQPGVDRYFGNGQVEIVDYRLEQRIRGTDVRY